MADNGVVPESKKTQEYEVWYSLLFHIIPCDNLSFSHSQITSAIFFFFFFY